MRPAYWELNRRGGRRGHAGRPRSPVVCGRKHCAGCGHWRHVCDFAEHRGAPRPRCRVCTLAYNRAWKRAMTADQRDRMNEYHRIWSEVQRRRQGVPARNFHHRRSVIDKVEPVGLPLAPLVAVIEWVGLPDIQLGAAAGVPPRSVYRLRIGEGEHVRLDVADKLAQALGLPLAAIYGDTPTVHYAVPPQLRGAS